MKIEWSDESKRMVCAKFILDRVITLYISEVFSDIDNDGVDVFGGWEGTEETKQLLDTSDPLIISRYWLIRWVTNITLSSMTEQQASGLLLYRQALLSSQKAINSLLTLMREAMQLPFACSNVIQKVLVLIRYWLLQRDIPPFIDSGIVSVDTWNVLLSHTLLSFFKSPYLKSSGDRLPAAISITSTILAIIRELANPSATVLPRSLSKSVWAELICCLNESVLFICSKPDAYSSATSGMFTRTLLSVIIYVCVIREIDLDDRIWDDVWLVFQTSVWTQVVETWTKFVESMTRALILNLFAIDVSHLDLSNMSAETGSTSSIPTRKIGLNSTTKTSIIDRISENGSLTGVDGGILINVDEEDGSCSNSSESIEKTSEKDFENVIQSTGNVYLWLRSWMRIINLVDPAENVQQQSTIQQNLNQLSKSNHELTIVNSGLQHQQLAVRALARSINVLLKCGCANTLVHWLATRLLYGLSVREQPHSIAPLCAVLKSASDGLPAVQRAYILHNLTVGLREDEQIAQLVLEQMSQMGIEELTVLSTDTISALQKLLNTAEFSSRAVKVAALLSLNHVEAEKILISLISSSTIEIDLSSLVLCINALSIIILERIDQQLLTRVSILTVKHKYSKKLLPIFCTNLFFLSRVGLTPTLSNVLLKAIIDNSTSNNEFTERFTNDLKWHLCSLSTREKTLTNWSSLFENFNFYQDRFFEGFLIQLALQYPLPGFSISQWNSQSLVPTNVDQSAQQNEQSTTFLNTEGAILSFEKNEKHKFLWSRTVVGRHCYSIGTWKKEVEKESPINQWLEKLSKRNKNLFKSVEKINKPIDSRTDPFQDLPRPLPRWNGSDIKKDSSPVFVSNHQTSLDLAEMLQIIQTSSHNLQIFSNKNWQNNEIDSKKLHEECNWRQFLSDFNLLEKSKEAPSNFHRDIRHLDSSISREVHKVAVIYVGKDQEEKQSILSNNNASDGFNTFVDGLGWLVQIGCSTFSGYSGGLPQGQITPYYASANTELIFHVSTILNGDVTQKLKHLGNDEVHVVWSEHSKPYKRELIATRFCDVLIVLYPVTAVLIRIHIEAQNLTLQFGPLFDGAFVHVKQVASLVRETVLNASRAYRNARLDCDRPNKHREKVFEETKAHFKHLELSKSITRLYAPSSNS